MTDGGVWLRARGLGKSFAGVTALADVDLDLRAGEVHGLVGQNGAGKSTLIKILAGVHQPTTGTVEIEGKQVSFATAASSTDSGIAVLHQEPQVIPDMPVYENMFLGLRPPRRGPLIARAVMRRESAQMMERLGVPLDVNQRTNGLSTAQTQMVGLGRCLLLGARFIIMDEPTASLGAHEVEQVYRTVKALRADGLAVVYVSHRLDEIAALCDRATVLRDGRWVAEVGHDQLQDRRELIRLILGTEPSKLVRADGAERGPITLTASRLTYKRRVVDVDLSLHRGEVTGIAGFVGAGRSELAHMLFGALRPDSGSITIDGKAMKATSPKQAIARRVALVPEDRRHQGSVPDWTVRENLTLAALQSFSSAGFVSRRRERERFEADKVRLGIKVGGPETRFNHLSGGNQQKVVIAKWLATDADVLLFDEPTQGVDVGAQEEIHRLVRDIARQGRAVLFISSDLDETLRISDRLLVMREGRIVADLDTHRTSMQEVLALCFGGVEDPLAEVEADGLSAPTGEPRAASRPA